MPRDTVLLRIAQVLSQEISLRYRRQKSTVTRGATCAGCAGSAGDQHSFRVKDRPRLHVLRLETIGTAGKRELAITNLPSFLLSLFPIKSLVV